MTSPTKDTKEAKAKDGPALARGVSPEAEPERAEPTADDATLVNEGVEAADEAAAARELPEDQKALQMTPEEYDAIGKGKDYEAEAKSAPKSEAKTYGGSDKG